MIRHHIKYDIAKEGETTLRSHLFQAGKEVDDPVVPAPCELTVEWFWALSSSRQNGMSINPISNTEILAWSELNSLKLSPFELRSIKAMDLVFTSEIGKS